MYDQLAAKHATLQSDYAQLLSSDEVLRAQYVELKQQFNAKIDSIKLELQRHPGMQVEDLIYFIDADKRSLNQLRDQVKQ